MKGRAFSDRYHARALTNRRQTRNAIAYTLLNRRKHGDKTKGIDPCSSGHSFDGFKNQRQLEAPPFAPQTWMLRVGWRIHGLIDLSERPGIRIRQKRSTDRGKSSALPPRRREHKAARSHRAATRSGDLAQGNAAVQAAANLPRTSKSRANTA